MKNCFYVTDLYDGDKVQGSNGFEVTNSAGRSLSQMSDGAVAYALGSAWGQNVDNGGTTQTLPVLGGAVVYYGYTNCDSNDLHYSNTKLNPTQGHLLKHIASENTISYVCSYCGGNPSGTLTLTAPTDAAFDSSNPTAKHTVDLTCTITACSGNHSHTVQYCCGSSDGCSLPGTHTATVTLGGATASVSFTIDSDKIFPEDMTVTVNPYWANGGDWYYTGAGVEPTLTVKQGDTTLVAGTDYEVFYSNNIEVTDEANATVVLKTLTHAGATKSVTFSITPYSLTNIYFEDSSNARIETTYGDPLWESFPLILVPTYDYEGGSMLFSGYYQMVEGKDFYVDLDEESYRALGTGTHTITVHGMGNFQGSRRVELSISSASFADTDRFEVVVEKVAFFYNGEIQRPEIRLRLRGSRLRSRV